MYQKGTTLIKGSELLELDERKMKILKAIIKNYLETGEPVGSRTISKYTDLPIVIKANAGLPDPNSNEYDITS